MGSPAQRTRKARQRRAHSRGSVRTKQPQTRMPYALRLVLGYSRLLDRQG